MRATFSPVLSFIFAFTFCPLPSLVDVEGLVEIGNNRGVKRLLLSIIGGFVLPFLYACISGPLSLYVDEQSIIRHMLYVPIGWPRLLYDRLYPLFNGPLHNNDTALFIYIFGCDVVLYALVSYVALTMFSILRRKKVEYEPPPPPVTQI